MHTTGVLVMLACTVALCAAVPGDEPDTNACSCTDVAPPGGVSCEQQREFGKCERNWMKLNNYCSLACGYCSCTEEATMDSASTGETTMDSASTEEATIDSASTEETTMDSASTEEATIDSASSESNASEDCENCVDTPPAANLSCEEQARFGKCERDWMQGFCQKSCNKCSCTSPTDGAGSDSPVEIPADPQPGSEDAVQMTAGGDSSDNGASDGSDGTVSAEGADVSEVDLSSPDSADGGQEDGVTGVSDTSSPVSSIPGTPIGSSSDATAEGENVATASVPGAQSKVDAVRTAIRSDSSEEDASTSTDAVESAAKNDLPESEPLSGEESAEIQPAESDADVDQGSVGAAADDTQGEGSIEEENGDEKTTSIAPAEESRVNSECQSVLGMISNNPDLTSLAAAIQTAKIGGSLDNKAVDITFFAPTNEAFKSFAELLGEDAEKALASPEALRLVLSNHVSRPAASAAEAAKAGTLTTLANIENTPGSLKVFESIDGKVLIDGHANRATVLTPDIQACDSIIHTIDAVLPPVDFSEVITAS